MHCMTFNKNELTFFILSSSHVVSDFRSLVPVSQHWGSQAAICLPGCSCLLCASHTLLRNRDWLISVSFMISVISFSCSYGCPTAEQAASSEFTSYITSRGSSSSFPNWVILHFHSSPLTVRVRADYQLSLIQLQHPFVFP